MERLTAFNGGIWGLSMKAVADGYDRYSVYSKLAEYENTDRTPEQIKILIDDFESLNRQQGELIREINKIREERDFWEREAKKYCSQLGEIRILAEQQN